MGGGGQTTLDSHTVPRFYLKQWSRDGKSVLCYRTVRKHAKQDPWATQSLKSASVIKGFYTMQSDDGGDDSVERHLAEHEAAAAETIKKIADGGRADDDDMSRLVDFAIVQWARSPMHLARLNEVMASSFEQTSDEAVLRIMARASSGSSQDSRPESEQTHDGPYPDVPLHVEFDRDTGEIITSLPTGQQSSLYAMGRTEQGVGRDLLRSYNWLLLECPPGVYLPTSDNPFVRATFSYDDGYRLDCGIAEPDAYLFMPITPRHLLIAKSLWKTARSDLLANQASRDCIIHAIVNNSHLYVYSTEASELVESARESRVDPKYLEEYEGSMKNWMGS